MRILAFNHFFEHDLAALRDRLGPDDVMDVVSYRRLHRIARRHFPESAFGALDEAFAPSLDDGWRRYRRAAVRFADWLASAHRPTVFVVPNDTFFYLRPVIGRMQDLGVKTVCVQKETTLAPLTLDVDSQVIRRYVPVMTDAMAVCSERHREFAIRCGAIPETVSVTGQPRFDVYARAREIGPPGGRPPRLLYLSFDDLAYLPADAERTGLGTWRPLRHEVEGVLARLAEAGTWHVVAKTHPQQLALDDRLGPSVERAPRGADTRRLIMDADAVLGFQTTALFEAAVAGRPILYAGWGPVYDEMLSLLIPFHEHPELLTRVASADELRARLEAGDPTLLPVPGPSAQALAEEHLGPVDGHATERVLEIVRAYSGAGPERPPRPAAGNVAVAAGRGVLAPALRGGGWVMNRVGQVRLGGALERRAGDWGQEGGEALAVTARR